MKNIISLVIVGSLIILIVGIIYYFVGNKNLDLVDNSQRFEQAIKNRDKETALDIMADDVSLVAEASGPNFRLSSSEVWDNFLEYISHNINGPFTVDFNQSNPIIKKLKEHPVSDQYVLGVVSDKYLVGYNFDKDTGKVTQLYVSIISLYSELSE